MKRDLIIAGILGLFFGMLIFYAASWTKNFISTLLPGFVLALIAFVILLLIALVEMPIMVFGIRKMAQQSMMPRAVITVAFAFYVFFAAVYAGMLVLLIEPGYFYMSMILVALGIARFISGIFIR